jgi:hypothetical protein
MPVPKAFIRLGCNQARVRVVLRNIGNNAFQQDRYGKHITITRWISKNSAKYTIETVKGEERVLKSTGNRLILIDRGVAKGVVSLP